MKKTAVWGLLSWNKHCIPAPTDRNADLVAAPRPPAEADQTKIYTSYVEKGDR